MKACVGVRQCTWSVSVRLDRTTIFFLFSSRRGSLFCHIINGKIPVAVAIRSSNSVAVSPTQTICLQPRQSSRDVLHWGSEKAISYTKLGIHWVPGSCVCKCSLGAIFCVCVCLCVRANAPQVPYYAYVCACVHKCVSACVHVCISACMCWHVQVPLGCQVKSITSAAPRDGCAWCRVLPPETSIPNAFGMLPGSCAWPAAVQRSHCSSCANGHLLWWTIDADQLTCLAGPGVLTDQRWLMPVTTVSDAQRFHLKCIAGRRSRAVSLDG